MKNGSFWGSVASLLANSELLEIISILFPNKTLYAEKNWIIVDFPSPVFILQYTPLASLGRSFERSNKEINCIVWILKCCSFLLILLKYE